MKLARLALVATTSVLVAACGTGTAPEADGPVGDEPTTPGAIAALVADRLADAVGEPTHGAGHEGDGREGVGVSLRLANDEVDGGDGDLLVVGVGDMPTPSCAVSLEEFDGCEEHQGGLLMWDEVEPEEDPGVYAYLVRKADGWASLYYAGDEIVDDPRTSDLEVPVASAVALLKDPALDLTTSQEWIDRGEDLDWMEPTD